MLTDGLAYLQHWKLDGWRVLLLLIQLLFFMSLRSKPLEIPASVNITALLNEVLRLAPLAQDFACRLRRRQNGSSSPRKSASPSMCCLIAALPTAKASQNDKGWAVIS